MAENFMKPHKIVEGLREAIAGKFAHLTTRVIGCAMHPHYSETAIYEWACDRCDFRQFGHADEKPNCKLAAGRQALEKDGT